jgi:hypothetical protein
MFLGILELKDNTILDRDRFVEIPSNDGRTLGHFVGRDCAASTIKVVKDESNVIVVNWKPTTVE